MRLLNVYFIFSLIMGQHCIAQIKIFGPTCVNTSTLYQYKITGASGSANFQICVSGGYLLDSNQASVVCKTMAPKNLITMLVRWSGDSVPMLSVIPITGNTVVLPVSVTAPLQGGQITVGTTSQTLYRDVIPNTVLTDAASGGFCNGLYLYQWEQSDNKIEWKNVEGATAQNLVFTKGLLLSTYYRRKVTEINSGSVGYSGIAVRNIILKNGEMAIHATMHTKLKYKNEWVFVDNLSWPIKTNNTSTKRRAQI